MVWIRTKSKRDITIRTSREALHALLTDVVTCGKLMPGVEELTKIGDDLYHYRLKEVSNGVIKFTPQHTARFDVSNPDAITWEPHGEHNFKSWGVFRVSDGPTPNEQVLEIDTRSEASIDVARVMVMLIEPFAQKESDDITKGFLAAIRNALESASVSG